MSNWRSMFVSVCVHVACVGRIRRSFRQFPIERELQKLLACADHVVFRGWKCWNAIMLKKREIYIYIYYTCILYDVTYARVTPMREIGCCVFLWISYLLSPMVYTGHRFKKRIFNLLRFKPRKYKNVKNKTMLYVYWRQYLYILKRARQIRSHATWTYIHTKQNTC